MEITIALTAGIAVASLISNLILMVVILSQQRDSIRERRNKELYLDRDLSKLDNNIIQTRDDVYGLLRTEIPEIKSKLNDLEKGCDKLEKKLGALQGITLEKPKKSSSHEKGK